MTLLQRLQNAVSKVDGNTVTMEDDRGYDEYFCKVCRGRVTEDKYNAKHSICFHCFYGEETT